MTALRPGSSANDSRRDGTVSRLTAAAPDATVEAFVALWLATRPWFSRGTGSGRRAVVPRARRMADSTRVPVWCEED
jgi:hypothetical protein